jgi:hypothetical protein
LREAENFAFPYSKNFFGARAIKYVKQNSMWGQCRLAARRREEAADFVQEFQIK